MKISLGYGPNAKRFITEVSICTCTRPTRVCKAHDFFKQGSQPMLKRCSCETNSEGSSELCICVSVESCTVSVWSLACGWVGGDQQYFLPEAFVLWLSASGRWTSQSSPPAAVFSHTHPPVGSGKNTHSHTLVFQWAHHKTWTSSAGDATRKSCLFKYHAEESPRNTSCSPNSGTPKGRIMKYIVKHMNTISKCY